MNGRARMGSLAASPTMVGAITTLIVLVAVFLAYNANNGLPFVPTYKVAAELCDAARLGPNNEVRIGGNRVGAVESIDTVPAPPNSGCQAADGSSASTVAKLNLKLDKSAEPAARRLDDPGALPLVVRAQVPRDHARRQRNRGASRRDHPALPVAAAGRVRRRLQHLRHRHPGEQPPGPDGLRQRLRRPRRLPERGDHGSQPAVREPEAGLGRPGGSHDAAGSLLPGARRRGAHRRPGRCGQRGAVHERRDRLRRDLVRSAGPARHDLERAAGARGGPPLAAGAAAVPRRVRRLLSPAAAGRPRPARRAAGPEPGGVAGQEGAAAHGADEQRPEERDGQPERPGRRPLDADQPQPSRRHLQPGPGRRRRRSAPIRRSATTGTTG